MRRSRQRAAGRITIKDVAAAAGVSATTVSNALNDRTTAMSEETLARIQEAMRTLSYRPNSLARSMITRRSQTLGLVLLVLIEIDTPRFLQALNVVEPIAREAGFNLLLSSARDLPEEVAAVDLLQEKQVEGIAFISTSQVLDDAHIVAAQAAGMPVVLVNRTSLGEGCDGVYWDNVQGTVDVVRYLVELGHRRIGFLLGPAGRRSTEERLEGYQEGLRRQGLAVDPELIRDGNYTADQALWERSTLELLHLDDRATAIIAADDTVGAAVMRTARRAGFPVPERVSVVGVDDQPFCTYLNPMLTTMRLPILEASEVAIRMLLERIAGKSTSKQRVQLPCELVIRESTGPRIDDK